MATIIKPQTNMKPPGLQAKKTRLSLRVPPKMIDDITFVIKKAKLSIKDRSDWVCNAIANLRQKEDYWLYVQEEWMDRGKNKTIQILLSDDAERYLAEMIKKTQEETGETSEEIKSAIIRTSIMQELIGNK